MRLRQNGPCYPLCSSSLTAGVAVCIAARQKDGIQPQDVVEVPCEHLAVLRLSPVRDHTWWGRVSAAGLLDLYIVMI